MTYLLQTYQLLALPLPKVFGRCSAPRVTAPASEALARSLRAEMLRPRAASCCANDGTTSARRASCHGWQVGSASVVFSHTYLCTLQGHDMSECIKLLSLQEHGRTDRHIFLQQLP